MAFAPTRLYNTKTAGLFPHDLTQNMKTTITNDNAQGRIDIHEGTDALGKLEYEIKDDTLQILHTYTFEGFEGQGVGKALVEAALDEAREKGLKVNPVCSFAKAYFERHPQHQDMLTKR